MKPAILILAGGAGRRMGGVNKALVPLQGRPLIAHLLKRIDPDSPVAIAAHDELSARALDGFGPPVLLDGFPDRRGPLAGVLAGLRWLRRCHPDHLGLVSLPVDSPYLSAEIAQRLIQSATDAAAEIAYATCEMISHYAIAYWRVDLETRLAETVTKAGSLSIRNFLQHALVTECEFSKEMVRCFININTLIDLQIRPSRR
jgi:molybdopterin-guanine dinucleotide biosynthesis protein A